MQYPLKSYRIYKTQWAQMKTFYVLHKIVIKLQQTKRSYVNKLDMKSTHYIVAVWLEPHEIDIKR